MGALTGRVVQLGVVELGVRGDEATVRGTNHACFCVSRGKNKEPPSPACKSDETGAEAGIFGFRILSRDNSVDEEILWLRIMSCFLP